MNRLFFFIIVFVSLVSEGQQPDHIYKTNIHSVKLYKYADQYSPPVLMLGSTDALELHFDDLDADVKNYYYTYELRNADWTETLLHPFDYTRGFQNVRITAYRQSSIAFTRYTHYQAAIPDRNSMPTRSGNYLLKVFLDGDTSKLVFTSRFLLVDNKTTIAGQIQQPFNSQIFRSHQKLQIGIKTDSRINLFSPQDLKVVVIQNYAWPTALYLNRPSIFRGNYYEYSDEAYTSFPAGKEWRWIDLRSLRLMSDRMQRIDKKSNSTDVYVKPDGERNQQVYIYYRDLNGLYTIETSENINPFWQGDYANVHFSFFPPGNHPYDGRNVYLYGQITNYIPDESSRMVFNEARGAYEKTLFLKQGFYNYSYVTMPDKSTDQVISVESTEGNYWGTENAYMILVYYRPFGGRADELIGFTTINSIFQRVGN